MVQWYYYNTDTFLKFAVYVCIKWVASVHKLFYIFIENFRFISESVAIHMSAYYNSDTNL